METGILSETKLKGKTRQKKMNLWIFATSNDVQGLILPLRSRFMELELQEYTYEEFIGIVRLLLRKKYHLEATVCEKIGNEVWHNIKSRDIRDALRIAKLTESASDVDWLIQVHKRYGKR